MPDPLRALIRQTMSRQGVTQAELARRIGWHQPGISAYLSGKRDISTRTLRRMCGALGVEIIVQNSTKTT